MGTAHSLLRSKLQGGEESLDLARRSSRSSNCQNNSHSHNKRQPSVARGSSGRLPATAGSSIPAAATATTTIRRYLHLCRRHRTTTTPPHTPPSSPRPCITDTMRCVGLSVSVSVSVLVCLSVRPSVCCLSVCRSVCLSPHPDFDSPSKRVIVSHH